MTKAAKVGKMILTFGSVIDTIASPRVLRLKREPGLGTEAHVPLIARFSGTYQHLARAKSDRRKTIVTINPEFDENAIECHREYLKLLVISQAGSKRWQRTDASDLVQQTLLDAVARKDQFRGSTKYELLAWLRRILANNLVDAIRYRGRAKRDELRVNSIDEEITKSFQRVDSLIDPRSTPSQRAATNDQLLRLPMALEALSEAQRDAIILHHLQGFKLSETSQRLGRSEAAVCGLLHRGLKRLHEILEE